LFRQPGIAALLELAALSGFVMFSLMFYVPLLLQGGFGLSPQQAGLLVTPLVLFITVGSIINGRLIPRMKQPKQVLYIGFLLMALACTGIVSIEPATPHALIMLYMLLCGTGLGLVMPNLTIFTQEMAGRAHLGVATAAVQSLRMVGSMLGTALVGTLVTYLFSSRIGGMLSAVGASRWQHWLADPQLLVSAGDQQHFLRLTQQAGLDGAAWIVSARNALVTAIHQGQWLALAVLIFALWRLRRVPPISLSSKQPASQEG
jgi:MFS family permease